MGAYKGSQGRGQMGYGAQGMDSASGDDELALDRVDNPQQPRKAFASKQQSVTGAYTADDDSGMDKDPITQPSARIMQRILGDR
jgi:hypothetical protein